MLIMIDLAVVSSLADKLMNHINELGLACESVEQAGEVYRKTNPLLTTLRNLNGGQGLGFVVLGVS